MVDTKMATISILANTVRPSVDPRLDDTTFGAGTFSWQDRVHFWKIVPGEVINVENKQTNTWKTPNLNLNARFQTQIKIGFYYKPAQLSSLKSNFSIDRLSELTSTSPVNSVILHVECGKNR